MDLRVLCILEAPGSNISTKNDCTDKNRGAQTLQKCWPLLKIIRSRYVTRKTFHTDDPPNIHYKIKSPAICAPPLPVYSFPGVLQSLHTNAEILLRIKRRLFIFIFFSVCTKWQLETSISVLTITELLTNDQNLNTGGNIRPRFDGC